MNDNDREMMVGAGQAAAAYAIWRNSDNAADAILDNAAAQGAIEGAHTYWAVTRNTGDVRLGRRAGVSALGRSWSLNLAVLGVPCALFLLYAVTIGPSNPGLIWPVLLVLFGVTVFMLRKLNHTYARNMYERANLPTEHALNKSGYWQVEPDVWFNPITNNVLAGHAYSGSEAAQGRRTYRDESQAIQALYRQMKGQSGASGPPARPAIQPAKPVSKWWPTGRWW